MNPKIQKLASEIEKTSHRITALQERLKELEKQRNELVNTEIIEMVRSIYASPEELAVFIKAFREKGGRPDYFKTQEEPHYE